MTRALVVLLLLSAASCAGPSKSPPVSVDLRSLIDEYRNNEVAADQKYRGKYLRVKGRIDSIASQDLGMVVSISSHQFLPIVDLECVFSRDRTSEVAKLQPDQGLSVVGYLPGKATPLRLTTCRVDPDSSP
jgi:hypothetical protein